MNKKYAFCVVMLGFLWLTNGVGAWAAEEGGRPPLKQKDLKPELSKKFSGLSSLKGFATCSLGITGSQTVKNPSVDNGETVISCLVQGKGLTNKKLINSLKPLVTKIGLALRDGSLNNSLNKVDDLKAVVKQSFPSPSKSQKTIIDNWATWLWNVSKVKKDGFLFIDYLTQFLSGDIVEKPDNALLKELADTSTKVVEERNKNNPLPSSPSLSEAPLPLEQSANPQEVQKKTSFLKALTDKLKNLLKRAEVEISLTPQNKLIGAYIDYRFAQATQASNHEKQEPQRTQQSNVANAALAAPPLRNIAAANREAVSQRAVGLVPQKS